MSARTDPPPFLPLPLDDVWRWIATLPRIGGSEDVALADCAGRVLSRPVTAAGDVPPTACATRLGFALRAEDSEGAGDYNPLPLRLVDAVGSLDVGCAMSVAPGDELPTGADAVLPVDEVDHHGNGLRITAPVAPGSGVIQAGEECAAGDDLAPAETRLSAAHAALFLQAGHATAPVVPRARVAVLPLGSEATSLAAVTLPGLIGRDGGVVRHLDVVDHADSIVTAWRVEHADILLVIGGTGYEEPGTALRWLHGSGEIQCRGVAINPGVGAVVGRTESIPVVILPATALAMLSAYELVAGPLLRHLGGHDAALPWLTITLPLREKIASRIGRSELARVRVRDGAAWPLAVSEDRLVSTLAAADGLVLVPGDSEGYPAGASVSVYLSRSPLTP